MTSSKLKIRQSPGKGRGVFARRYIEEGELIATNPVLVIPNDQRFLTSQTVIRDYVFGWGVDQAIALGNISLVNHDSDNPNSVYFCYTVTNEIVLHARRNIKKGEEITIDYGYHPLTIKELLNPNKGET